MTSGAPSAEDQRPAAVLANRSFLLLWLSQVLTQIGGNMVLYGLTVVVVEATNLSSAVSALFLTFLVPAVLLSAVAGVYVDRVDRRMVLVVTNVLRAFAILAIFLVGDNLALILLLNVVVSTITVFFAPAEASMIPFLVPREQLVQANGLFTLTLNGAFALGFALLGPLIVTIAGRPEPVILVVAMLYGVAAAFCWTLPPNPPGDEERETIPEAVAEAEQAMNGTLKQLREGVDYIRANRTISWSLIYLGIAASVVGVVGVLGPKFAEQTLGLEPKDLVVVVLPLGLGIVMGVLILNNYGHYVPRRRGIEGGLIALGILLLAVTAAGPISRFLTGVAADAPILDLSAVTSLVSVVVALAFLAGISYGIVAISSQTQLQEDLPEEVRGRVFGVLNMLVSVASFLPIIVVGTIADVVGTTAVILFVAAGILASGIASIVKRGPLLPGEAYASAGGMVGGEALDPIGVAVRMDRRGRAEHAPSEGATSELAAPEDRAGALGSSAHPTDEAPGAGPPARSGDDARSDDDTPSSGG